MKWMGDRKRGVQTEKKLKLAFFCHPVYANFDTNLRRMIYERKLRNQQLFLKGIQG